VSRSLICVHNWSGRVAGVDTLATHLYYAALMLPQRIRPTVATFVSKTFGALNLDYPAFGVISLAQWARFARWCKAHPVDDPSNFRQMKDRGSLYDSVIHGEGLDSQPIDYLEFGVYKGQSMRSWVSRISHLGSRFVGFDTFTGLPERWRRSEPKGWFNADGITPNMNDTRATFEVGLFQDTLPGFVKRADLSRRLVFNMDADLFTSTFYVLATFAPHLKPGDIFFFDEFSCPLDEYRAFDDFIRCFHFKYEVLGATPGYTQVCVKIL
jgi:O-methyltransferase